MSTNNPNATAGDTLVGLPRSVRWRIQLGLLVDPSQMDPTVTTFSSETDTAYLESVFQWNQDTISQQTTRFHQLMEQYVEEEMTPEEEEAAAAAADMDKQPAEVEVLDPLTAMVMEQEARETRKAELLLKYRKERARRKRGLTAEAGYVGEDSDGIDRASVSTYTYLPTYCTVSQKAGAEVA